MERFDAFVRIVAAGVGIVALAIVAITLGEDHDSPSGGGGSGIPQVQDDAAIESLTGLPEFLQFLFLGITILGLLAMLWYILDEPWQALRTLLIVIGLAISVIVIAWLGWFLLDLLGSESAGAGGQPEDGLGTDEGSSGIGQGGEAGGGPSTPTVAIGALLIMIGVVAVFFIARRYGGRGGQSDVSEHVFEEDEQAIGDTARRAADRIESTDGVPAENEVYRAWLEMTNLLDVDRPASSTPREFAAAATDAGMEPAHVDELTALFEDVRYGGANTTETIEERAVSIFRRIETEYGDQPTTDGVTFADGDRT